MIDTPSGTFWRIRNTRKDIGVAMVIGLAFLAALFVREYIESRAEWFYESSTPFRIAYPVTWSESLSLQQNAILKIENPSTPSAFKTSLTIERRELDPASPPTLQTLLDRRVADRSKLTAYHFLSNNEVTLAGAKGVELYYAYTVQPIDEPRRASLPVVVQAREIILIGKDRSYYITLAAPQNDYERASAQFDKMLGTLKID